MSHELRSPLSSILLLSRDLAANEEGNLTEEQIEIAEIVHSSGNGLLTLINDILDLSKVEAGKMTLNPENVHLADIAVSIERSFGRMVKQKGLELSINVDPGTPPTVHTDRLRVEQVIKNLMANAIKFTSSGKITMDIYKPQKDVDLSLSKLDHDKAVAVSVTDTGIGIPPDRLEHIFEVFNQAENSTSHKFGGTGLGLSISRELAKLLGGEIQLESEVDKGSKFTFYFNTELTGAGSDEPLLEESARVSHRQVENLSEQKKETITKLHDIENMIIDEKILLVDDDMRNVYALSKLLTGKGANVLKAANGADALKILDENQDIDIVLMDIMMPVMDGYEATRKIRSQKQFAHLPIIALTAKVMPEDRDKCIEAGCSDYLAKPVDFDQLLSLMINWLKHKITS